MPWPEGHNDFWTVLRFFSEEELVSLTAALMAINGWNWLAIAFRAVPGAYQPVARGAEQVK